MILIYSAFILTNIVIALYDFLYFRIPNLALVLLLLLFLAKWGFYDGALTILYPFGFFFSALVIGFVLFAFRIIGAGDAKYFAVASLWTSTMNFPLFLIIMSLSGGILGYGYLKFEPFLYALKSKIEPAFVRLLSIKPLKSFTDSYIQSSQSLNHEISSRNIMPYGVAISMGCILSTLLHLTS